MKKSLFLFALLQISFSAFSQGSWVEKNGIGLPQPASQIPFERDEAFGFTVNNVLYYGSGYITYDIRQSEYQANFYAYDVASNRWSRKNDLPFTPRINALSFNANGLGYVLGGYNERQGLILTDCYSYVPSTDSWTQIADFPGTPTMNFTSFTNNGKAYMLLGSDINGVMIKDVYEYNSSTGIWSQKATFPGGARYSATAFTVGQYSYVCGGMDSIGTYYYDVWRYDPFADNWVQMNNRSEILMNGNAFSSTSLGFVIGAVHDSLEIYNPATDSWTLGGMLPELYSLNYTCFSAPYVISNSQRVYQYDSTNDMWILYYEKPKTNIYGSTVVVQQRAYTGENVYDIAGDTWTVDNTVASGTNWLFSLNDTCYANYFGSFQAYDPVSHVWVSKSPFPGSEYCTLHMSINNKGYIGLANGIGSGEFWEYDPFADSWTRKADFPEVMQSGTNAFSIGTKGYVYSGYSDSTWWVVNNMWEYDPAMDVWTEKSAPPAPGREHGIAVGGTTRGYIGLGTEDAVTSDLCDMWEYIPATDTWNAISHPLGCRRGPIGFMYNDLLYTGIGHSRLSMPDSKDYFDFYEYTPAIINHVSTILDSQTLTLYPVPATDIVTLQSNKKISSVKVVDAVGRFVIVIDNESDNESIRFSTANLSPGLYFVFVNESSRGMKLIKE